MGLYFGTSIFANNNSINRFAKRSPFSIVYTKVPRHVIDPVKIPFNAKSNEAAFALTEDYTKFFQEVQYSLEEHNLKYKVVVDKHRKQQVFEAGDQVMIYLHKERLLVGVHGKLN